MITEDYVSFETAKLLKEKGFNDKGRYGYNSEGNVCEPIVGWKKVSPFYPRPTHQMAMKWLREVHNIDVDIEPAVGMLGVKVYIPFISTYKSREDDPSKVRQLRRGIYYKDDKGIIPALQHFDSYEEACEVALKYSLENLIK